MSGNSENSKIVIQVKENCQTLSIIVPVYNEQEVLPEFHKRLTSVINTLTLSSNILYVNDGSTDTTLEVIRELSINDNRISFIDLSRNFGKEIALTAGFDYVSSDAVVVIDADLQDPPELIPELLNVLKSGYDVVYGQRTSRKGETFLKKFTAKEFYRFMKLFGRTTIPQDTGDFRVLSRRATEALKQLREHHRFMKGLFTWIGYKQKAVLYERDPRHQGQTKWNYWKLWNFALEGITSYTSAPLKLATYFGFSIAICSFIYALTIIVKTLLFQEPVKGYPSLMVVILFLGGIQLIFIGFIGEYLGRTYNESKNRPLYFLNEYRPSQSLKIEEKHV